MLTKKEEIGTQPKKPLKIILKIVKGKEFFSFQSQFSVLSDYCDCKLRLFISSSSAWITSNSKSTSIVSNLLSIKLFNNA
jgi:hypothetical protein